MLLLLLLIFIYFLLSCILYIVYCIIMLIFIFVFIYVYRFYDVCTSVWYRCDFRTFPPKWGFWWFQWVRLPHITIPSIMCYQLAVCEPSPVVGIIENLVLSQDELIVSITSVFGVKKIDVACLITNSYNFFEPRIIFCFNEIN